MHPKKIVSGLAVVGLAVPIGLAAGMPSASAAPPGYNVYVGYADNLRPSAASFPTPFDSRPGVTLVGEDSTHSLDSGTVRIENSTGATETVDSVVVHIGSSSFDLWPHNMSLGSFDQIVLDQTSGENFDTSDVPNITCTPDGLIPTVDVTVDGVTTTYADTGQVLNTGGVDAANCGANNESTQWVSIGAPPCPSGAVLTLSPSSQADAVGSIATVTASFESCGTPLQGAEVDFVVTSGPNAGLTGLSTVDASGNATFAYTSSLTGTDTVTAFVTNGAGEITSNDVLVTWDKAVPSLSSTPPPSVPVGGTIGADSATLSGAVNPSGLIEFGLFGPGDPNCVGPAFYFTARAVVGNGTYSSGPAGMATVPGTYKWAVVYTGDANNTSVTSACGVEQTVVTPQVLTGQAFGLSLSGLAHLAPQPNTGPIATTSTTTVTPPCIVDLNATVVKAKVVCASVQTFAAFPSHSAAQASIASAVVVVPGLPVITIGAVQSASATSCAGSAGATTIVSLTIGHTVLFVGSPRIKPNTTLNLGVLKIVLNQQIPITGAERGLTVNAIHITALNNAINLIVASSSSDIGNCP